jgi:hypothetical protein
MAKKTTFVDEAIDATEQVGRVVLKGAVITAKTTVKITGLAVKETAKGIKRINQKVKDRNNNNQI